ncbi:MAG: gamma-glutamyl-gamma-aminobutyrate hydrolase family protein [Ahrensia sp.]|nr:gamma-glutamyl-gamma-aminobutyrate hydrolase family protein [Ahrensia sp.]
MQPIVAIVADKRHFDNYDWHCVPDQYLAATLDVAGVLPLIVPAFGARIDFDALLDRVDGVILSGSKTNVHPENFGQQAHEKFEPYDRDRDATSLPLIRAAVEKGVPLFAICRGIQEMNVALGGSLATEIQENEGRMDHRVVQSQDNDVRFQIKHPVTTKAGGCVAQIIGGAARVNSLHRQAIDNLAPRLQAEAVAEDGTIEAVSVIDAKGFAVGVQWHPEYWARTDVPSRQLFEAFGDAVTAWAAQR